MSGRVSYARPDISKPPDLQRVLVPEDDKRDAIMRAVGKWDWVTMGHYLQERGWACHHHEGHLSFWIKGGAIRLDFDAAVHEVILEVVL